ncbi:MAG TPA: hypothetical protein DCX78_00620 [Nitrospina sp.]|nr:hypothetical protein [Nitrospinaceae bacterium]MDP7148250.1 hypothetical protein [Nitrospinaceae bacterium]HAX45317.1 hypothetical protein [Nitrospina sp.]
MADIRYLLEFEAASGFKVVLEFGGEDSLNLNRERIEEAGLNWRRLPNFNVNFDSADLFMDMRSPVCASQFDLDDWL